jgi:hypothetical protein
MNDERRDQPRDQPDDQVRDPEEQRLPGDDQPTEPLEAPVDERSYAASGAEPGGEYHDDRPTVASRPGDTMGTRDEAPPGEELVSEPYSG